MHRKSIVVIPVERKQPPIQIVYSALNFIATSPVYRDPPSHGSRFVLECIEWSLNELILCVSGQSAVAVILEIHHCTEWTCDILDDLLCQPSLRRCPFRAQCHQIRPWCLSMQSREFLGEWHNRCFVDGSEYVSSFYMDWSHLIEMLFFFFPSSQLFPILPVRCWSLIPLIRRYSSLGSRASMVVHVRHFKFVIALPLITVTPTRTFPWKIYLSIWRTFSVLENIRSVSVRIILIISANGPMKSWHRRHDISRHRRSIHLLNRILPLDSLGGSLLPSLFSAL